jgi:hypothetical protein
MGDVSSFPSPNDLKSPATPNAFGFAFTTLVASLGAIGVIITAGWWFKLKRTTPFATVILPMNEHPSRGAERWGWNFGLRNSVSTAGSSVPVSVNLESPDRAYRTPERRSVGGTLLRLQPTASFSDDRIVHVPDSVVTRGEASQQRRSRIYSLHSLHSIQVTHDVSVDIEHLTVRAQSDQGAKDSASTLPRYATPSPDTPPPAYQTEKTETEDKSEPEEESEPEDESESRDDTVTETETRRRSI